MVPGKAEVSPDTAEFLGSALMQNLVAANETSVLNEMLSPTQNKKEKVSQFYKKVASPPLLGAFLEQNNADDEETPRRSKKKLSSSHRSVGSLPISPRKKKVSSSSNRSVGDLGYSSSRKKSSKKEGLDSSYRSSDSGSRRKLKELSPRKTIKVKRSEKAEDPPAPVPGERILVPSKSANADDTRSEKKEKSTHRRHSSSSTPEETDVETKKTENRKTVRRHRSRSLDPVGTQEQATTNAQPVEKSSARRGRKSRARSRDPPAIAAAAQAEAESASASKSRARSRSLDLGRDTPTSDAHPAAAAKPIDKLAKRGRRRSTSRGPDQIAKAAAEATTEEEEKVSNRRRSRSLDLASKINAENPQAEVPMQRSLRRGRRRSCSSSVTLSSVETDDTTEPEEQAPKIIRRARRPKTIRTGIPPRLRDSGHTNDSADTIGSLSMDSVGGSSSRNIEEELADLPMSSSTSLSGSPSKKKSNNNSSRRKIKLIKQKDGRVTVDSKSELFADDSSTAKRKDTIQGALFKYLNEDGAAEVLASDNDIGSIKSAP